MQRRSYEIFKRIFDVSASSVLILLLSPLFLAVVIALKIESPRAPVIYTSKRVGRYYKVFGFIKFRSMRPDSDRLLAQMQHLNQYKTVTDKQVVAPVKTMQLNDIQLFSDEGWMPESQILEAERQSNEKPFLKISNDPRITKVGHFIRNTSIDELPQLINVLRGDMSLVGNRPLPLYEAEQLTTDESVERFSAPAGITGLWQVTDRGKKGVSADSRKQLDVEYARRYSMALDFWILFKTPLAALQSDNV
jgi:lipopolysaccharide/colanic/teichoic acid biosynthesis glycosyltransferase